MAAATKEKRFQWNKGDKTLLRHAKMFPPTPIWNIFPYHILPPLVRASILIYNLDRPALSTNDHELGELGDFFSFFAGFASVPSSFRLLQSPKVEN